MEVWEVFQQKGHHDPFVHVGSVLAPDRDMAMSYAKECFFRRMEGRNLWITKRSDVHELSDPDLLQQVTDKSYRYPEAYRGVVQKREVAHARFGRSAGSQKVETGIAGDEFEGA